MDETQVQDYISALPDEVLSRLTFSMPWQYDASEGTYKDPDGFPYSVSSAGKEDAKVTRDLLQAECWEKFHKSPQLNTATRGLMGRLTGYGFDISSEILEIDEAIDETMNDPRNRLYDFLPKYVGRALVEGELFVMLTVHEDGFVEVDFIDPAVINGTGEDDTGIIWHPNKQFMPLFYNITDGKLTKEIYPSIFIARYPELEQIGAKNPHYLKKYTEIARNRKKKFTKFNGFYKFIISWNKGLMTKRAVSYMRTTLEWLNYYENLKKYEIDHKKSSGSYMWVFSITEPRMFKQWLSMSDEDKRKTGIMAKKTPGGSLILPPGVTVEVKNPQLAKISETDTDILDMVSSGLNETDDIMQGHSRGTYASVKASKGPMSDRVSDEIAYFDRFLRYDLFDSIFFLKSEITDFKYVHKVKEATSFDKDGEPVFENRKRRASELIDIQFPTSETVDYEARARGLMGVKHGPATEVLGIPYSEVARRMGFGNYGKLRLKHATEKERYPELIYTLDAESLQEIAEGETIGSKGTKKPTAAPKPKPKKEAE
jgi:hypothetical protein